MKPGTPDAPDSAPPLRDAPGAAPPRPGETPPPALALLRRVGGILLAPRTLLASLSPGTGQRDGAVLLLAYLLAVGVPSLGDALADLRALGGLAGLLGLAQGLLPLLPWLITASLVEWRLGPTRAHRAALCMVPMLVLGAAAQLLTGRGVDLPGPGWLPAALGALAALALASRARPAVLPDDLSPGTATPLAPELSRRAVITGGSVAALVGVTAALDVQRLVRVWPTLAPVAAGDPVPDFTARLLDGGTLVAADLRGAPHLLIFWTTWCGVCASEMPMYRALAGRHAAAGLRVIAVNADREGDVPTMVRAYRDRRELAFPIALDDGALTRGFRVRMYPHLVLIDAAGQVRGVFQGRTFERSLEAAIAGVLTA